MKRKVIAVFVLLFSTISCQNKVEKQFKKLAFEHTAIDFVNQLSETPELNILTYLYYYNGAGVVAGDFNNDSLVDLYFTGNQVSDELYLNKGGFTFQKVTKEAQIENGDGWTTGATHVDINNDGLLDLYVCKVGNYKHLDDANRLYINQGVNDEGVPTFKEDAKSYGLDFSGFSTHSAFFDFDLDGDLDMYLMNHSVYPNRTYGKGNQRKKLDRLSGDILFRNDDGKFVDISAEAGIYQGKSGYGLGLSVSDVNNDGFPDIYVGNDFFENDYLYINRQDGTFQEMISNPENKLGHTTHYSMGNDIADVNNDGLMDIISLDMLPENLETYKTSGLEYGFPIYQQYLKNGFAPQYMQNTLHLNLDGENFAEIGNLSGLSATEWSWGALLADFDNDGKKDVFVSNGIKGATNDMDFISFISNDNIQRRIEQGMSVSDMPLIEEIPEKKIANYIFKNNGDLTFSDVTDKWLDKETSFSNGSIYADLDNDGDLDIVVNNVDQMAYVMENTGTENNSLAIEFKGNPQNNFGIGAKVLSFSKSQSLSQENFNSKGYLSAVSPIMHLGLGKDSILDSLKIIWPGGAFETLHNVATSGRIKVNQNNASSNYYHNKKENGQSKFSKLDSLVNFVHDERASLDFDREPLVPFANSNEGPDISVADVNNDGLDDFLISGAKTQSSELYVQEEDGQFHLQQVELFQESAANEDTSHLFFNANGDPFQDLIVVSGGNEFKSGKPLQPRLYLNHNGVFKLAENQFDGIEVNASKVLPIDFDQDGDQDVIIVSDQVPGQYGKTPAQYLFSNDGKGNFAERTQEIIPELSLFGNIKDAVSIDIDANGYEDLIVVGHWMSVSIFLNDGNQFKLQKNNGLQNTEGWWNTVELADMDKDGDLDLVCGNWGHNSKFKASQEHPITLYLADFDDNGSEEPVITHYHKNTETPFASKDELAKQMPFLNKNYLSYKDFAAASVQDLFGKVKLDMAAKKSVVELGSVFFENNGHGNFTKRELPKMAQASPIYDFETDDLNEDGYLDLLIVGNNYEISTQLGRLDAFHGLILQNDTTGGFNLVKNDGFHVFGAIRTLKKITIAGKPSYVAGRNNDSPIFLVKNQ
ncbi:VCBS repeat-containing protein [Flagellimonas sp. S3867]|uniref:VCBS repeat-containing protein n=1 Tax=Flagellimonas sp. S3867 TaxID=2768063 RepID=UPI001CC268C0|nr:VCBS repeat-containing protein [Flagellimonas sp. S3867]